MAAVDVVGRVRLRGRFGNERQQWTHFRNCQKKSRYTEGWWRLRWAVSVDGRGVVLSLKLPGTMSRVLWWSWVIRARLLPGPGHQCTVALASCSEPHFRQDRDPILYSRQYMWYQHPNSPVFLL